jgi:hypothetical protein
MRKILSVAATLFALFVLGGPVSAGPQPALPAPTGFTCSFVTVTTANDTIHCDWEVLDGATTKYSVDTVANFELGNTLGPLGADFDFGTPINSIDIPLSSFPVDINADLVDDTLVSVVLRVKGLNPPGKRLYNQNNPFSTPTVTCVVSTATCSQ